MDDKKFKYIQWLLYGLMGLSALFTLLFYLSPSNPDMLLYWMYALLILSGVVTLASSLFVILKNPKGSFKILGVVGAMIVLGIISYALSKNTYPAEVLEKYNISANGVKMVGAGLIMTYFIMLIAIGVFIYTSLSRFFK
ncbi:MAG: hypothetical protein MUC31_04325 [Bacteroidales bacterium]|jgi:hypothetical protein|nr:hypothetical protein [Bacteroidales bacterium]